MRFTLQEHVNGIWTPLTYKDFDEIPEVGDRFEVAHNDEMKLCEVMEVLRHNAYIRVKIVLRDENDITTHTSDFNEPVNIDNLKKYYKK